MKQTCNPLHPSYHEKKFIVHFSLFIFFLSFLSSANAATWESTDNDIFPGQYMDDHALVWEQLPLQWNEGAFIGNGIVGAMIYVDTLQNTLTLHLSRPDITDHRKAPDKKTSMGAPGASKLFDYCRLDVGKMRFEPQSKIISGTMRLDIYNAEVTGTLKTADGDVSFRAYTPYVHQSIIVEVDTKLKYNWRFEPGSPQSPRTHAFPETRANYASNPLPEVANGTNEGYCLQKLLAGGDYATAWKTLNNTLYVTTINETPQNDVSLAKAKQELAKLCAMPLDNFRADMYDWWHRYFQKSYISLPDKQIENFYYIQMYKLATCSHPQGPAMDVMGTFFKMTQWPGIWWNLNIQLTYMSVYPTNRLEQGENFMTLIDELFEDIVNSLPVAKIGDFAWTLHNYYTHLRYAGADWNEIKSRVVPKALFILNKYRTRLDEKDGVIHILQTESPEYEGMRTYDDSNYNLAALKWILQTLMEAHDNTKTTHDEYDEWRRILNHLSDYPIDENGFMIARDVPVGKSHRHYSHLLALYPLRLLDPKDPAIRALAEKSIDHWLGIEEGQSLAGYSYTGSTSLYAFMGNGNKAYRQINHFLNKPLGISILLPNTMYVEADGKNPVIETPLSAATAIAEMLIQSWDGKISVFPAIPDHWDKAFIHGLRAMGGFEVSAQFKNHRTEWITISSEKGNPCIVKLPGWTDVVQISNERKINIKKLDNGEYSIDLQKGETITLAPNSSAKAVIDLNTAVNDSDRHFYGVKQGKGLDRIMEWPMEPVEFTVVPY